MSGSVLICHMKKDHRPYPCRIAILVLITIILAVAVGCSRQVRYPSPPVSGSDIVISITSLPLDVPQFYTLSVSGKPVSFFVLRLPDKVVSYFDACVNCYRQKMGYAHEHGFVVCRACGTNYSIYKLDKGVGGCYPILLKGTVDGGTYRSPVTSVEEKADKF
jgi:uncharacterized membrane protein